MKLLIILTIFFVQFTDKGGSDRVALSPTALEMRSERGIAIDSLDYAVSDIYLDSIRALGGKVLHTSRWMNGATVDAKHGDRHKFMACSFVDTLYTTRKANLPGAKSTALLNKLQISTSDSIEYGESLQQLQLLNLPMLHEAGYEGQGIRIGVADASFTNVDSLEALAAVREQWLGYTDLTDDKWSMFDSQSEHGTLCLSAIMGIKDDYVGAATKANYYIFKTEEEETESPKEIDNWVAAIEMADSMGLHIVSTSLGYALFDHNEFSFDYEDMNGQTTRGAKAASIAARKGLLLVVAMGNDGTNTWHYLSTPADADSILSVGAVSNSGKIAPFSSYGPTSDERLKPEVCAVGYETALIASTNKIVRSNGTSFACPQIAGLAACLWSASPKASNMDIRQRIIESADRYANPDARYGYGIPDAWVAYENIRTATEKVEVAIKARKVLRNGQLYLYYNNEYYSITGQKLAL